VDILLSVPERVMSIEVAAPHHMAVVAPRYAVRVFAQKVPKRHLSLGVGAGIVDVEDRERAVGSMYLYSCYIISIWDFDYIPGLSVDFGVDPYRRPDHCPFLPSVSWVYLSKAHRCSDRVELCNMWFLEEYNVPSCSEGPVEQV